MSRQFHPKNYSTRTSYSVAVMVLTLALSSASAAMPGKSVPGQGARLVRIARHVPGIGRLMRERSHHQASSTTPLAPTTSRTLTAKKPGRLVKLGMAIGALAILAPMATACGGTDPATIPYEGSYAEQIMKQKGNADYTQRVYEAAKVDPKIEKLLLDAKQYEDVTTSFSHAVQLIQQIEALRKGWNTDHYDSGWPRWAAGREAQVAIRLGELNALTRNLRENALVKNNPSLLALVPGEVPLSVGVANVDNVVPPLPSEYVTASGQFRDGEKAFYNHWTTANTSLRIAVEIAQAGR